MINGFSTNHKPFLHSFPFRASVFSGGHMPEWNGPLQKAGEDRWLIPKSYKPGMRVDGMIYASERLLASIREDQAPEQVANVAFLPGILGRSMAMPDIHWGYGFPIGGVAAMDFDDRRRLARRSRLRHQLRRPDASDRPRARAGRAEDAGPSERPVQRHPLGRRL